MIKRQYDKDKDKNGVLHSISTPSPTLCETKLFPKNPVLKTFILFEVDFYVTNHIILLLTKKISLQIKYSSSIEIHTKTNASFIFLG